MTFEDAHKFLTHSKTSNVSEETVIAIPPPEAEDTYRPVAHRQIIEYLNDSVNRAGISVVEKRYSITKEGARMFGMWIFESTDGNGIKPAIGFRNSLDKSMSMLFGAGTKTFICDNLAFGADWIAIRKHTSGLSDMEILRLVQDSVSEVLKNASHFLAWHLALKKIPLTPQQMKTLMYNAMRDGVYSPASFKKMDEALSAELGLIKEQRDEIQNEEGKILIMPAVETDIPMSMYHFHAAITRMVREEPLFKINEVTAKATKLINRANTFGIY